MGFMQGSMRWAIECSSCEVMFSMLCSVSSKPVMASKFSDTHTHGSPRNSMDSSNVIDSGSWGEVLLQEQAVAAEGTRWSKPAPACQKDMDFMVLDLVYGDRARPSVERTHHAPPKFSHPSLHLSEYSQVVPSRVVQDSGPTQSLGEDQSHDSLNRAKNSIRSRLSMVWLLSMSYGPAQCRPKAVKNKIKSAEPQSHPHRSLQGTRWKEGIPRPQILLPIAETQWSRSGTRCLACQSCGQGRRQLEGECHPTSDSERFRWRRP